MKQLLTIMLFALALPLVAQTHTDSLMQQLASTPDKIFVVSHRGDWRNTPENSLQAVQNCIDMGVDMVEIDLKKTKDGHVVLMHDKLIDRTTTGKGRPGDYTLAELKEFRLKNGVNHRTDHLIPTLEEVMLLAKGKILINIDKGYDYLDEVYEVLERTGTIGQCVIKSDKPYEQVMAEKPVALEKMIFMPVIRLDKPEARTIIESYQKNYKPMMFELCFENDGEANQQLIELAKKDGAKVFINTLWPELCGGHHDDRAVEGCEPDQSWGWLVERGATLLQTDRPEQMLKYLSDNKMR